jgi:hypothetical protein
MKKKKKNFNLEFVSLRKEKDSPLLLLVNKCKLSYFIGYRCLNLKFWDASRSGCVGLEQSTFEDVR